MTAAVQDILTERSKQVDDYAEFDKTNSRNDWIAYLNAYSGRACAKLSRNEREGHDFRTNMVKVGALALAAVEAHDKGFC